MPMLGSIANGCIKALLEQKKLDLIDVWADEIWVKGYATRSSINAWMGLTELCYNRVNESLSI